MFNLSSRWATARKHLTIVLVMVGILWVVLIADALIPDTVLVLSDYGIWPRTIEGLLCIPAAPFLHVNIFHLMGNTPYLVLLGWIVAMSGKSAFLRVFAVTALASGLGAWAFGDGSRAHLGVSGVLYGMIGFLLARGWFSRRLLFTLVALVVGVLHLAQLLMLLHNDPNISWACHFWGFTGGIVMAWWMYGRTPAPAAGTPEERKP